MLALSITWAQRDSLAWEAKIVRLRLEAIQSSARKLTYIFAWSAQLTPQRVSFAWSHTQPRRRVASPQTISSSAEELSSDFAIWSFQLRCELDAAAPLRIWYGQPLTNQISRWDQIYSGSRSNPIKIKSEIKFDSWLHLTLLKWVKGSGEIFQLYGKD